MKNLRTFQLCLIAVFLLSVQLCYSQSIKINEVSPSNNSFLDEDGEAKDWIELYNASATSINLHQWSISDNIEKPKKWVFPDRNIAREEFLTIFASGKDRQRQIAYQTVIVERDTCRYIIPDASTNPNWRTTDFDDQNWNTGITGIGYADGDDATIVPNGTRSVFLRQAFMVENPAAIAEMILQIDYDDAFIAYINGQEIARANIPATIQMPGYVTSVGTDREAEVYRGGDLEKYIIENAASLLVEGKNVLAIQVHNVNASSSDMSIIPFLTLGTMELIASETPDVLDLSNTFMHTNFKIKTEETIYLFDATGLLQDSLFIPVVGLDRTVGRFPDGVGGIRLFDSPTPNATNIAESFGGVVEGIIDFSQSGGLYEMPLSLVLSTSNTNATIRYTIDGSDPTHFSPSYQMPIPISTNKVIKARLFQEDLLPSPIHTQSYLINQTHQLPVLALVVKHKDFFDDETGIYTFGKDYEPDLPYFGANFWKDIEVPIHISLFEKEGLGFATNAGVKIFGGWSRASAQRSLSIFFRGKYGDSSLKYPLFETRPYDKFEAFVLRNSGNDWQNTMIRDLTLTSLMKDSNVDIQAGRPMVTYINGDYWGFYNLREKINEHFLSALHEVPTEDITILEKNGDIIFGDNTEYLAMVNFVDQNNMSNPNNYQQVAEQMDLANYIQYQVAQIYFNNTDWPGNNIKFWKHTNGKWRWILFDTDFGFGIWNDRDYENNTLAFALQANGGAWPNPPWSTLLFRRLMDNDTFKKRFINTFADELNTRFRPTPVKAIITEKTNLIRSEMTQQIRKWGGTSFENWQRQINNMQTFAGSRPFYMRQFMLSQFSLPALRNVRLQIDDPSAGSIQLNTIRIQEAAWTGTYFQSVPITVTAIPEEGYTFDRWSGLFESTEESYTIDLTSNQTAIIQAHFIKSDPTTAIEEINPLKKYVQIAPNPVEHQLLIQINLPKKEFVSYEIMDNTGKVLRKNKKDTKILNQDFEIDVTSFSAGTYWLRLQVGNKELVERIIKF